MTKLFLADRAAEGQDQGFDLFQASLSPAEAAHPIAAWIAAKRGSLDWTENVADMVSRYFHLPVRPQWTGELGNGYEEAALRLERRLRSRP